MARRRSTTRMTREQRYRTMDYAAFRRIGHEHAYAIWFWRYGAPGLVKALAIAVVVAGLAWLWLNVAHLLLGIFALAAALAVTIGWLVYTGSWAATQKRMAANAAGGPSRGAGLGWAVAALVAILGSTAWLSLWSQWA